MRKLKFRAWSEEQKKFIQGYPLGEEQKNGFTVCGVSENGEQETTSDGLVLMQFTGLLDKKGKEIYESDVIIDGFGDKRVVEFNDGCFWACRIDEEDVVPLYVHCSEDLPCEVIGNTHSNPELL